MSANPKLEQLEHLIEGFKVCPPLSQETAKRIGSLGLTGLNPSTGRSFILTPDERQQTVIERAALGDTTRQAAEYLKWDEAEVVEVREQLYAVYRVPAMSAVVDQAIVRHTLPVTVERVPGQQLTKELDLMLEAFRVGVPTNKIRRALRRDEKQFKANVHTLVRKRLGANGRTNSIYRAYERGTREIPEQL